jgi:hypothetical protein
MNEFSIKEKLTAMMVLQVIDENVKNYAIKQDRGAACTAVLSLAMDMHKNGIDRSFVNELGYPDAEIPKV